MSNLGRAIIVLAAVLAAASPSCGQDFPLSLEVISFGQVNAGYITTSRQYFHVGNTVVATGGSQIPRSDIVNTAILSSPDGKIKCVLWSRRHYLYLGKFRARYVSGDEIEVAVHVGKGKKRKGKVWKFVITSASKVE